MGTYLKVVDYDHEFRVMAGPSPTIINDLPAFSEKNIEQINKLIYTTYSGDLLSSVPSCPCGTLTGEYNYSDDPETAPICPNCFQRVKLVFDEELEVHTWIRAPHGVTALMNPLVWSMINDRFKSGTFSVLHWICDPYYRIPGAITPKILPLLESMNIPRGYNNFVANFDSIMDLLFSLRVSGSTRAGAKSKVNFHQKFLKEFKHCIFSQHLPIPHNTLLVVEDVNSGSYVDPYTPMVIDAIITLAGIDTNEVGVDPTSIRLRESRTVSTIVGLAEYYSNTYAERMAKKEGIFRKNVFASRSHFSFRAVISSITAPHDYRGIFIPWGVAVALFRLHLVNILMRMGFTPNESLAFLNKYTDQYHPLLDQIFKDMISSAPSGIGIGATLNRNPSLMRGSIQRTYILGVKTDPDDPTVSMSILIIRSLNADFDGKQHCSSLNFSNCWETSKACKLQRSWKRQVRMLKNCSVMRKSAAKTL